MRTLEKKDWRYGAIVGFLVGVFFLPILKTASPEWYRTFSYAVIPFFLFGALGGLVVGRLVGERIPVIWQISKFGLVGVLNSFIDLGVLSGVSLFWRSLLSIDASDTLLIVGAFPLSYYVLFKTISFIVSNANSFFWNKHWTFENGKRTDRAGFLQFFSVSLIGLVVNVLVATSTYQIGIATTSFTGGQWGLVSGLAGIFAGLVWNFLGYKFVVFRK
jgi:putative flippase GtrA